MVDMSGAVKFIAIFLTTTIILIGAFFGFNYIFKQLPSYFEEVTWQTYTSDQFGFEVDVPSNWTIVEFPNDEIAPRVNMYPKKHRKSLTFIKGGIEHISPITHHSEISHVSIFPFGVPTEGFFGEFLESDVSFFEHVRVAHDFILDDGSRFATFAAFSSPSEQWGEAGFIFSRARVTLYRMRCFRDGRRVRDLQCDPLTGDVIVHYGTLDAEERETQKRILSSFRFVSAP